MLSDSKVPVVNPKIDFPTCRVSWNPGNCKAVWKFWGTKMVSLQPKVAWVLVILSVARELLNVKSDSFTVLV